MLSIVVTAAVLAAPPLPKAPLGFSRFAAPAPRLSLDLYHDLCCPFSKKMFVTLFGDDGTSGVATAFEAKYPGCAEWNWRPVPQPWHAQSSYMHEAALAAVRRSQSNRRPPASPQLPQSRTPLFALFRPYRKAARLSLPAFGCSRRRTPQHLPSLFLGALSDLPLYSSMSPSGPAALLRCGCHLLLPRCRERKAGASECRQRRPREKADGEARESKSRPRDKAGRQGRETRPGEKLARSGRKGRRREKLEAAGGRRSA